MLDRSRRPLLSFSFDEQSVADVIAMSEQSQEGSG
jgi:hypothetical protein